MLSLTGWALLTWLRITLTLAGVIGLVWWLAPAWLWLGLLAGAAVQVYVIRQLGREWSWQARTHWWWSR